jgi:hypothetical protein
LKKSRYVVGVNLNSRLAAALCSVYQLPPILKTCPKNYAHSGVLLPNRVYFAQFAAPIKKHRKKIYFFFLGKPIFFIIFIFFCGEFLFYFFPAAF